MKVSIALCTSNGQAYLKDQLESYLNQSRLPDELVVCDDVSSDNTVKILEEFAGSAPFPVLIRRNDKQLGYVKNFEKCVLECSGDIIFFSDQDDVWNSQKIELMLRVFEQSPGVGVVFCDAELVDGELQSMGRTLWETFRFNKRLQNKIIQGRALEVLIKMDLFWGLTIAFRSSLRDRLVPFYPGTGHDTWTAMLIAFLSDIAIVQKPLVKYRQHSRNVTGVRNETLGDVLTKTVLKQKAHSRFKRFTYRAKPFEALKERLLEIRDVPDLETKVRMLEQKIHHLQRRASMSSKRLVRSPQVLRELISLRYYRYSRGNRDFIKDLLEKDQSA